MDKTCPGCLGKTASHTCGKWPDADTLLARCRLAEHIREKWLDDDGMLLVVDGEDFISELCIEVYPAPLPPGMRIAGIDRRLR